MKINYLIMIWDVKILLAKIKDCKGREIKFSTKKSLTQKSGHKYHKLVIGTNYNFL